jgi:hypothetical protein
MAPIAAAASRSRRCPRIGWHPSGHPFYRCLAPILPLDQLRAAGEIEPATGVLEDLPEPLDLAPGVEPPSEVLARLRRDER